MTDMTEAAEAPAQAPAQAPAEAPTLDNELDAVWDTNNAEPVKETDETSAPEADGEAPDGEPVEEPSEEVAPQKEGVEFPSYLPADLKKHWGTLPETTRAAISKSHRDMSRKLTDQGREIHGIAPIKEVLIEAAQTMPFLAKLTPAEAATQVMETAKIAQKFQDDPVGATLLVIDRYGTADAIRNVLGGQPAQNQITPQQIQQMVGGQFEQMMAERETTSVVDQFSGTAAEWDKVADDLPTYIELVSRKTPNATAAERLQSAYDMAIRANGLDKAPAETASSRDAATPDPEQAEAAARAVAVNVTSKPTGRARKLTEDELLDKVYSEMQSK
jgi:hypothetical protein